MGYPTRRAGWHTTGPRQPSELPGSKQRRTVVMHWFMGFNGLSLFLWPPCKRTCTDIFTPAPHLGMINEGCFLYSICRSCAQKASNKHLEIRNPLPFPFFNYHKTSRNHEATIRRVQANGFSERSHQLPFYRFLRAFMYHVAALPRCKAGREHILPTLVSPVTRHAMISTEAKDGKC